MTVEYCAQYCIGQGFFMFGLEYTKECYCGSSRRATSVAAPETDCNLKCTGNNAETCGGPSRLSIYLWS